MKVCKHHKENAHKKVLKVKVLDAHILETGNDPNCSVFNVFLGQFGLKETTFLIYPYDNRRVRSTRSAISGVD